MLKRLTIALVVLLVVSAGIASATEGMNEENAIRDAVDLYIKGAATAEPQYFEKCFDVTNAHMKFVGKNKEGIESIVAVPIGDAIKGWTAKPPEKSWGKIISIDNADDKLAVAKVELLFRGVIYLDYLTLYKVNGEWKIVNKVFVRKGVDKS